MKQSVGSVRDRVFVRDVIVSMVVLFGLYGIAMGVQFQPLQIPGYLLMLGFVAVESVFGTAGGGFYVTFAAYLLGLGVVSGVVTAVFRDQTRAPNLPSWRFGVAGALAVTGVLSLVFSVVTLVRSPDLAPTLTLGFTGVTLLVLTSWLAGFLARP